MGLGIGIGLILIRMGIGMGLRNGTELNWKDIGMGICEIE